LAAVKLKPKQVMIFAGNAIAAWLPPASLPVRRHAESATGNKIASPL
jgi:hypothetical protein